MQTRPVEARQNVRIRALELRDLPDVARVHAAAFPASMLTKLGPGTVRRYYRYQLEGPHEVHAFAATLDDGLAGFCFGGVFSGAVSGFVRKNAAFLVLAAMRRPWLFANPTFHERLRTGRKAVAQASHSQAKPAYDPQARPFDILAIAVDPAFQGAGIGTLLMDRARNEALGKGFTAMTLMVNTDNDQAVRFYRRIGWEKSFMNGTWRGNMVRWLDRPASD